MNISGVIIKDKNDEFYFGFVKQFPAVCAQGDTVKEVNEKINIYWKSFIDRMSEKVEHIEMEMTGL